MNQEQKGHRDREEIIKKNEKKNLLQEKVRLNRKQKHLEVWQLYIFHHSFFHQVSLVLLNLNYKSKQCGNSTLNKLKMKLWLFKVLRVHRNFFNQRMSKQSLSFSLMISKNKLWRTNFSQEAKHTMLIIITKNLIRPNWGNISMIKRYW